MTVTTPQMSHRDACNAIATYAMNQLKWCDLAAVEVAGRRCGTPPKMLSVLDGHTRDEVAESQRAHAAWMKSRHAGGGQIDVLALSGVNTRARKHRASGAKRWPDPRVAIFEVKVQRSDLLSDLRSQKLRRYEPQASHVYLAVGADCLLCSDRAERLRGEVLHVSWAVDPDAALAELDGLGLPSGWGVVVFQPIGWNPAPKIIRNPTGRHEGAIAVDDSVLLPRIEQVAVSLCYRAAR